MFSCLGVIADEVSDAAVTSDDHQVPAPPRPTRRLTGLRSHTLPDQQHPSLSPAAADSNLPEETSPGEMLLTYR